MNLGQGVSLQSLYMLRDSGSASQAGQFDPRERAARVGSGYGFSHADLATFQAPTTPGWPRREPIFGGRSAPPPAGIFHMGSLGSIPRQRGLEAGQINPNAFAAIAPASIGGAPGIGGPYPSFGPVNPNAQPAPGQPDGQPVQGRAIGFVPTPQTTPPQTTPPPGGGTTPPAQSSNLPWLVGGGVVLAFLFLGTQKKNRRKRA